jgi:uncharacterized coiled-coil protein SlyX
MFTRILIILGVLLSGGAGYLAYQNREEKLAKRNEDSELIRNILDLGKKTEEQSALIAGLNKDIRGNDTALAEQIATAMSLQGDIARKESELTALNAQITEKRTSIDGIKAKLQELPPGMTIDTLNEDIAKTRENIGNLQTEAAKLAEAIAVEKTNIANLSKQVADAEKRQAERRKTFSQNSLNAIVSAVNPDWGFVIISAGAAAGIAPDTDLIVHRGGMTVGKVRPIEISTSRTVANIDFRNSPQGIQIQPGDRVTFEKPKSK